jgi:hypothetical protein
MPLQIQFDPLYALKHARDNLALEAFSLSTTLSSLKGFMPNIIRGFASNKAALELPPIVLKKDQFKFLKVVDQFAYAELMDLKAFRPEGVKVKYLQYLAVLTPITTYLQGIQKNVTSPYLLFLAQVVSDRKAALSTRSQDDEYRKLEATRTQSIAALAALYEPDSYESKTTVSQVVDRNADWKPVFIQCNQALESLKAVNLETLKNQMTQCSDYLEIIHGLLQSGALEGASPEVAKHLANGAYNIALEFEFFATTYYRAMALSGSIENTTQHILSAVG